MRVEYRRRTLSRGAERIKYRDDVVLVAESEAESRVLDLLGDTPHGETGVCSRGTYEVILSDDASSHYVALRGPHIKEEAVVAEDH